MSHESFRTGHPELDGIMNELVDSMGGPAFEKLLNELESKGAGHLCPLFDERLFREPEDVLPPQSVELPPVSVVQRSLFVVPADEPPEPSFVASGACSVTAEAFDPSVYVESLAEVLESELADATWECLPAGVFPPSRDDTQEQWAGLPSDLRLPDPKLKKAA